LLQERTKPGAAAKPKAVELGTLQAAAGTWVKVGQLQPQPQQPQQQQQQQQQLGACVHWPWQCLASNQTWGLLVCPALSIDILLHCG
jgi:hypothetical protein